MAIVVLCFLMIGVEEASRLSEAEIRALLVNHPLIEFGSHGEVPCTEEETLAVIAIGEHSDLP